MADSSIPSENEIDLKAIRKVINTFSEQWVIAYANKEVGKKNTDTFRIISRILSESIIDKIEEYGKVDKSSILYNPTWQKDFEFLPETYDTKINNVLARLYMDIYPSYYFKAAANSLFAYYNLFNKNFYDLTYIKERQMFENCQEYLYGIIENTLEILINRVEQYYYGVKNSAIETLLTIMKYQDKYTKEHTIRVGYYADLLAKRIFHAQTSLDFKIGSQLHDIGKIGIPQSILQSPNKLSNADFTIVKKHPTIGAEILNNLQIDGIMIDVAKYHHERWDGNGYPIGLKKEEIPLTARIIGVIDSFDAMTTKRPYCNAFSLERALEEVKVNKEKQFDPDVADIFLDLPFDSISVKPI